MDNRLIKLIILGCWIFFLSSGMLSAQTVYVYFKDKGTEKTRFDPYGYFDPAAVERRECAGLPLFDESDLPVCEKYLQTVTDCADETVGVSRWLNVAAVKIRPHRLEELKKMPFISKVEEAPQMRAAVSGLTYRKDEPKPFTEENRKLLRYQTERLKGNLFASKNISGKGVKIAVLDVGFSGTDKALELSHLKIIDKKDFVKKSAFEFAHGWHGTAVLSCIGGKYEGLPMGLAPDAEFLLARTERQKSEPFAEEIWWAEAAEWSDKNGAHLLNSSLGYTDLRYQYKDMNGKTTLVTRAANKAAAKGIAVFVAQGNEGDDKDWLFLGAPADADSVISVGGTDPYTDYKIGFSSWGPTYDRRLKPNVSAPAYCILRTDKEVIPENGTSFATPLVCGFAACMKEQKPGLTGREIFTEIQKSGHLYPYFDYAHGYGIPQADYFFGKKTVAPTFKFEEQGEQIMVRLTSQPAPVPPLNLYYAIENEEGILEDFGVIQAESEMVLLTSKGRLFNSRFKLRVHFEGFTDVYSIKD